MSAEYRTGVVVESKPGFVRLRFDDLDGMVSGWLPTSHASTRGVRGVRTMLVGNQAGAIMDARCEQGQIIGATHSDADPPATDDPNIIHEDFGGGFSYQINQAAQTVSMTIGGCTFTLSSSGLDIQGGDLTVNGIKFLSHRHGKVQTGGDNSDVPTQ